MRTSPRQLREDYVVRARDFGINNANRWLAIEALVDLRARLRISAKKILLAVVGRGGGGGLLAWLFKRNGED